ncbi:MAG TPA: hypothetical protein VF292_02995 [Rhodanobacteraceae bacterium]
MSLRWRIRCDPNGAGVFTTDQILPGGTYLDGTKLVHVPETPAAHWADVHFLSLRHARSGLLYNATVLSALRAAVDDAENWADDRVDAQLTDDEKASLIHPLVFEPAGSGTSRLVPAPATRLERFGHRTQHALRADALEAWLPQYAGVRLGARLEPDYAYGQGLTLILPTSLTVASIADGVRAFLAGGERIGLGDPVPPTDQILACELPTLIAQLAGWERWLDRRECGEDAGDPPEYPGTHAPVALLPWR